MNRLHVTSWSGNWPSFCRFWCREVDLLALTQSGWLTVWKFTSWVCGTSLSTLERKSTNRFSRDLPPVIRGYQRK